MIDASRYVGELAPGFVVRAARFPLRAVLALADAELADDARAAVGGAPALAAFAARYDQSIERQREILSSLTIGDARFRRALCLTNEELSERLLGKTALPEPRNKRSRHLETTLYRYLARAVWRTAPCDLWTGVALGAWGERTEIAAEEPRHALAPDLRPYQAMVQALSQTPVYAGVGRFRLNPTLSFDGGHGCWRYTVRGFDATLVEREMPSRSGLDLVLRFLENAPSASLAELADGCARSGAVEATNLREVLSVLRHAGLLVGGLTFPTRFSSAWEALFVVARALAPAHATAWRRAARALRRLCRRLERDLADCAPEELHARLAEARRIPVDLACALGVAAPALPRSILRADLKLPHRFVLGPEWRRAITAAIAEYDAFDRRCGIDAAVRAAHRRFVARRASPRPARAPEPGVVVESSDRLGIPTQEWAWHRGGEDAELGERLRRLSRWLATPGDVCVVDPMGAAARGAADLALPPVAGMVLRPSRAGFTVTGSTTEVVPAYGRYGALWHGVGAPAAARFAGSPLNRWYLRVLGAAARDGGVEIVEQVSPCERSPNGLAAPRLGLPVLDLWGVDSSPGLELRLPDLRVDLRAPHDVPIAVAAGRARPLALTCLSPMNVAFGDQALERLLLTSFREIPTWIWPGLPMACEARRPRRSPRLELPSGNLVRAPQTVLTGPDLEALVKADRRERFLLWQALARRHRWPALVLVTRDAETPVLLVRDSPLALEAVLDGIAQGVTFLSVEEPDDHAWLVDDNGDAFITELIVPYLRRGHAWAELAASERAPAAGAAHAVPDADADRDPEQRYEHASAV